MMHSRLPQRRTPLNRIRLHTEVRKRGEEHQLFPPFVVSAVGTGVGGQSETPVGVAQGSP